MRVQDGSRGVRRTCRRPFRNLAVEVGIFRNFYWCLNIYMQILMVNPRKRRALHTARRFVATFFLHALERMESLYFWRSL